MLKRFTQKNKLLFQGILIGVAYGVGTRVAFGETATLVSLSFLFIVPAVLGIIPLIFANDDQVRSYKNIIFVPWLTVVTVFLVLFLSGLEEVICLLILGGPFFVLATVGALIYRLVRIHEDKKRNVLLTLILVPFLFSPVEEAIESPSEIFTVTSEVQIAAKPAEVWKNIIRVQKIKADEYEPGIFNYLGVPSPVEAILTEEKPGALRIGHFEGGLTFIEHITEWDPGKRVSFDITVDPKTIRKRVFDQHVLKGDYFSFVSATYEIGPMDQGFLKLRLISSYKLDSKLNFYNKFWGDLLLKDFQNRLLGVIERRCDKK